MIAVPHRHLWLLLIGILVVLTIDVHAASKKKDKLKLGRSKAPKAATAAMSTTEAAEIVPYETDMEVLTATAENSSAIIEILLLQPDEVEKKSTETTPTPLTTVTTKTQWESIFQRIPPPAGSYWPPLPFEMHRIAPKPDEDEPDYEDLLFDDYEDDYSIGEPEANEEEDESIPVETSKYLSSEVCGRKLYCRRGDRGPCQPNEIFVSLAETNRTGDTFKRPGCSSLASYPWNGCMPWSWEGSSNDFSMEAPPGVCKVRFSHRPCFGFPQNYRFYRPTQRCYPSGWANSGPCPPNKIFVDVDGVQGGCLCRDRNHLLWKTNERCYRAYTKGPCQSGEWLEPESNGYSTCRACPCPDKADGRHIYWNVPGVKSDCYKSFSNGPCRRGTYFIIEDYVRKKARCVNRYAPISPYGYGLANSYGYGRAHSYGYDFSRSQNRPFLNSNHGGRFYGNYRPNPWQYPAGRHRRPNWSTLFQQLDDYDDYEWL